MHRNCSSLSLFASFFHNIGYNSVDVPHEPDQCSHGSSSAVPTVLLGTSLAQNPTSSNTTPAHWTRSINHHAGKHVHQGS